MAVTTTLDGLVKAMLICTSVLGAACPSGRGESTRPSSLSGDYGPDGNLEAHASRPELPRHVPGLTANAAMAEGDGSVVERSDLSPPRPEPSAAPLVTKVLRFAWRPRNGTSSAYRMQEPEDQHSVWVLGAVRPGHAYPVVVSLHGQPKRGHHPRTYQGPAAVLREVGTMIERGELPPLLLALPVYRHFGQPWPAFDLEEFRTKLEELLSAQGILAGEFYAFGHSAAAGCGGDGLNRATRLRPSAVAYLDTCVGPDLGRAVRSLHDAKIRTYVVHSVETAGFSPRQPSEYMATFDFGQVYRSMGLRPIACPADSPNHPLRDQPFRCAATPDGVVRAFVVDTGDGEAGHEAALLVGLRYFLRQVIH